MHVSLDEYARRLAASRLMSADEVAAARQRLPAGGETAEGLARQLVQAKRLTKHQAAAVYQNQLDRLVLGKYEIVDVVAAGGMGIVYKARRRDLGRVVALKVLAPHLLDSPTAIKRFQREVSVASRLEHPHIVTAYEAGQEGNVHFLVMQFVDGCNLADLIKTRGPMNVDQAIDCLRQTAEALHYAHASGVVHRDIKPGNLMLDRQGVVKILDMGLARYETASDDSGELSTVGSRKVVGTFDYMAPEQARHTNQADARCDIYSLGCTLYTLLTGRPPYGGKTPLEKVQAHRESPRPLLRAARPDVPEALEAIFQRMIRKQPRDRFQSMAELIAALDALTDESSPTETAGDSALSLFFEGSPATAAPVAAEPAAEKAAPFREVLEKPLPRIDLPAPPDASDDVDEAPLAFSPTTLILLVSSGLVAAVVLVFLLALVLGGCR